MVLGITPNTKFVYSLTAHAYGVSSNKQNAFSFYSSSKNMASI